jgi:hypothetical protein
LLLLLLLLLLSWNQCADPRAGKAPLLQPARLLAVECGYAGARTPASVPVSGGVSRHAEAHLPGLPGPRVYGPGGRHAPPAAPDGGGGGRSRLPALPESCGWGVKMGRDGAGGKRVADREKKEKERHREKDVGAEKEK